jgi:hypothetical protein
VYSPLPMSTAYAIWKQNQKNTCHLRCSKASSLKFLCLTHSPHFLHTFHSSFSIVYSWINVESFHFLGSVNNGNFGRSKYLRLTLSGFLDGPCSPFCLFYFKASDPRSGHVYTLPNTASCRRMVCLVIRFTLQKPWQPSAIHSNTYSDHLPDSVQGFIAICS